MTTTFQNSKLHQIITDIWQNQEMSKDEVFQRISQFDDRDWLLLATIDLVSLVGPSRGTFVFKDHTVLIFSHDRNLKAKVSLAEEPVLRDKLLLLFADFSRTFYVEGVLLPSSAMGRKRDALVVVELLSYIYYHLDSISMLPYEQQQERLRNISKRYDLPSHYLEYMSQWIFELNKMERCIL